LQDFRVGPDSQAARVRLAGLDSLEHLPTSVANAKPDAQVSLQPGVIL